MSALPWMPLYVADYLADTGHLSAAEHGAYLLLIMHYWRTGPLPSDHAILRRISRLSTEEWAQSSGIIIAFFQRDGDQYRHKRIDDEIAEGLQNIEDRRNRTAAARAARYVATPVTISVTETPSPSPSPSPIPVQSQPVISPKVGSSRNSRNPLNGHQDDFDAFWATYPRRVAKGKAVKAYAKAILKTDPATILAAAIRFRDLRKGEDQTYTAYPASWLNGECWTDDFTIPGTISAAPDPAFAAALEAERLHKLKHGEIE